jgi:hypothetical protein
MKIFKKINWKKFGNITLGVILAAVLLLSGLQMSIEKNPNELPKVVLKVGEVSAYSGTPDYIGLTDVVVQQALNALPATGGEIQLISPVYTFTNTVSRAINNVTITGQNGTTIIYAGAAFSVGAQTGWKFQDIRIAVGGSITNYANAQLINVAIGATVYGVQSGSIYDTGLTAGRVPYATTGGLLTNDADLTFDGTTLDTNGNPIDSPTGRGATYVIAASDATALEKSQADVVCDGVEDDTDIQAFINTLVNGGSISFSSGHFSLLKSVWINNLDNIMLYGQGNATVFSPANVVESTLAVAANPGDGTVNVANGSVFRIGQQVMICTKNYTTNDKEPARITNVVGNVITLESNLALAHGMGSAVYSACAVIEALNSDGLILRDFKIDGNLANQYYYSQNEDVCNPIGGGNLIIFQIQNGIFLKSCKHCIVESVSTYKVAGWGGIVSRLGSYNQIIHCDISYSVNHGIILGITDAYSSIEGCKSGFNGSITTKLGHGICVEASGYNQVIGNFTNNNYADGYYLWSTGNNIIVSSNVSYHDPMGINCAISEAIISNNIINPNTPTSPEYGVIGISSTASKCILTGNKIYLLNQDSTSSATAVRVFGNDVQVTGNEIFVYPTEGSYYPIASGIRVEAVASRNNNIIVSGNTIQGEYTTAMIYYTTSAVTRSFHKVIDNVLIGTATTPIGVLFNETQADADNTCKDNTITGCTTQISFTSDIAKAGWVIDGNVNYIARGEIRTISIPIIKTGSTLTTVTGTFTESPATLKPGANTLHCTADGTANIVIPTGCTGTVASVGGGATVATSPVTLAAGTTLITVTAGGTNEFTVTVNAFAFALTCPELQNCLITKVEVDITTAGGTATSTLKIGMGDTATDTSAGSEFFTAIDANAIALRDSYLAGDTGAQTKYIPWNYTGTDDYLIGKPR